MMQDLSFGKLENEFRNLEPQPEDLVCVPDVIGENLAQAATLLRQRGLEMQIDGTGLAVRQEPAAGEYAAWGSVVKVQFAMPNP